MLREHIAEHHPDAAALDDRRGRPGIEVEHERARLPELVRV